MNISISLCFELLYYNCESCFIRKFHLISKVNEKSNPNVYHIATVEAKQSPVAREIETLKENKKTFERILKGLKEYVAPKKIK